MKPIARYVRRLIMISILALPAAGFTVAGGNAEPLQAKSAAPKTVKVTLPGGVRMEMVRIAAGSFQMGSPASEEGHEPDEVPVHAVTIRQDFYIGKTEVTQEQWQALMKGWPDPGKAPAEKFGLGKNYPAYFISWHDSQKFIEALNAHIRKTGQGPATFRLPTEAEWEYACRAGTKTPFFFGDLKRAGDYMWFTDNNTTKAAKPVATKLPNPWGVHDMSGNVWEWCQDWYHSSYEGAPSDERSWDENPGEFVILRGGDFDNRWGACRSPNRNDHRKREDRSEDIGLRLARSR
jgi:eukaryotic-like serine/threonine-protein kinase